MLYQNDYEDITELRVILHPLGYQLPRCRKAHLDNAPDVHLCNHLCCVEKHEQRVQGEGDILQRRVVLECHGCVHAHRNNTYDGTYPQQRVDPLQERARISA